MRVLHTSDWHLGDRLLEKSRQGEFRAFLDWLLEQVQQRGVEAVLVSRLNKENAGECLVPLCGAGGKRQPWCVLCHFCARQR